MDPSARAALLQWYDARKRDLPWRRSRDPYAILVSEVMLQQTRVETVLPYYAAWMAAFPTLADLAAADEEAVLLRWQGLGYYSRARNLHRAAQVVVAEHDGRLPQTAAGLRTLPGIGPYTAGAVASIAYGVPVPAVDGNVVRVIARLATIEEAVDRQRGRRQVEETAAALVDPTRPGDWNQAVMELGATVCLPRAPRCTECPVAPACRGRAQGIEATLPCKGTKRPPRAVAMHFAAVEAGGRLLLVRNPDDGLLAGMWSLPGGPDTVPLEDHVRDQTGALVRPDGEPGQVRHLFTHRVWEMAVHRAEVLDVQHAAPARATRWQPVADLGRVPLSTAARKAIQAAGYPC